MDVLCQRVGRVAVFVKAGQNEARLELTADLVRERVPEAERFTLVGVAAPMLIRLEW